ncbi:MAG: hypothetical protein HY569_02995 [Candidatus Magasanikbacteria bacterium]|nr:hypothetical protein [Candidatus Magasanikbacteria bacterium]
MNKLRDLVRAVWLLAIFVLGTIAALALDIIDWICVPAKRGGDDIITPLEDSQVPEHLQPIVTIRREAALVKNYHGPIAWYFRGNVTFAELVAEFGHAMVLRKIFGQQTDGIWPSQPTIVFWSPLEIFSERTDCGPSVLKEEWGLPDSHSVSRGRVLVLYLLLLRYHRLTGRSALPYDRWVSTEFFPNSKRALISYDRWFGYKIYLLSWDEIARGELVSFFLLGTEPANNFTLKQAA